MPSLSTDIMVHRLPIKEECKPIQQKLQRMRPDVMLKIKEEVKKQFDTSFLQVVKYSEWIANIVHVPKKYGKVQMCIDYRDLNKASPKDNFPLPYINTLVDNTTGYLLFSSMDGFSKYNQIKMHPKNMEKTTFVTIDAIRTEKCRSNILKSHEEEHVKVLRKLFLRLRKFQLKLNPAKSTFEATLGKLLGFVVSEKGIEIDLNKVKAIQELPPSRTQKEVQGVWDEKCQKTFDKFKHYLFNAPVLMPPSPNKPLILYVVVFGNSIGCVLGQHDKLGRKERAVNYLSEKFTECEIRYSPIEKLCCSLIWTTQRLREYMLYHTTWLISKMDPLKYMIESTALNGRMGCAIADFLTSRALKDYEHLNFDFPNKDLMALNAICNRIEAILISLNGDHYPFTNKLDFDCTNNMAEYKACIMGIRVAIEHKIKVLEVYGDFALVIYQLKGEWEMRDPKLIDYRKAGP
ncbi:RNA-directed DNA polymerase (Reverse transcriptase), Ribonuclease H-like protein [Gossypium australe]|uniref:RNA-directed DNA polymerase (Reverse transcriptase), Ribonuclease H-like protein n=1 Tax=Gossypium australe TaxID=47621 RepID=A0A5B6UY39_9ROSI|nr:RNA-directed DNA polymerase (Reverse transcriptase), Ribonuclease H-like protein [Gossypium australe]